LTRAVAGWGSYPLDGALRFARAAATAEDLAGLEWIRGMNELIGGAAERKVAVTVEENEALLRDLERAVRVKREVGEKRAAKRGVKGRGGGGQ
jgi:hypothetical protein